MSVSGRAFVRRAEGGTIMSLLPRLRFAHALARVAAAALVIAPLAVLGTATPASAAPPNVTVNFSGGGNVIAGNDATYSIGATTGAGSDGFNLALFLDVPDGVAFVSSSLGSPVIYSNVDFPSIPVGTFRWVWEDVSDLPVGGTYGGTVTVHPTQPTPADNTGTVETAATNVFPVGSSFTINGYAALSGDPTYLPVFDGSTGVGTAPAIAETTVDGPDPVVTSMIALELTKNEPSPEAELPRGVHDQTTVYTLTIINTSEGDTAGVLVYDFLPAALEFLGCGNVDNSTVDRDVADAAVNEYDTAASLTGTPFIAADCPAPVAVTTVVASAGDATAYGVTAGSVYTRVEWDLGTIAAGSTTVIHYAAGIPLYENTTTFDGASTPTGPSLGQVANLDNNNGPSTRHGDLATPVDGVTWTNVANVFGDYQGIVRTATSRTTSDRDAETVYAMDLAVQKSITAGGTFDTGTQTTFQLNLEASEYMDSSVIVLTDTMGNGLCPLVPTGTPLINPSGLVVTDCTGIDGVVTGATVESVTAYADGTWDMVLHPTVATIAANGTHTITYNALNRDEYELAPTEYGPTTSGDGFGNIVSFTAVTDAVPPILGWFPETLQVWDDSGASIASDYTTIDKTVMPRSQVEVGAVGDPCTLGTFSDNLETGFRMGDTVCFNLNVTFPSSIDVRNPVITDFLPRGMTYAGYEVLAGSVGPIIPTTLDASAGRLEWKVGTPGAGGDLYVARGSTFNAHLWATIDGPSSGPILDKPENLMKYRQQNVEGDLYFLRDAAEIEVHPEMDLIKGVEYVLPNGSAVPTYPADYTRAALSQTGADGSVFASNRDGILVREAEQVRYRVDLTTMPYGGTNATVWDVLPPGVTAADVSAITDGGYAADPGGADDGYPGEASYPGATMDPSLNTRSVVVWTGVDVLYDAGVMMARKTLNYTVTVPVGTAVATTHDNDASIISYGAAINTSGLPGSQMYYPTDSYNVALGPTGSDLWNTPGTYTRDDSSVYLPSATIAKTVTSPLDTNNTALQAAKGEIIHFTYGVTIPAHTSVVSGALYDTLTTPTNWTIHDTLTTVDYPGGSTAPGDTAFSIGADAFTVNAATGRVDFPALYSNTTDSDQVFQVNLYVHVRSTATWTHNTTTRRDDTATFSSGTQPTITATSGIYVIEPGPSIVKTVNDAIVTAGQTVTYTLSARNNSSNVRPTSFDTRVTDCVPVELAGVAFVVGFPTQGSASLSPDVTCPSGTSIVWDVGSLLSGSANYETLQYTATVSPASAGGAVYTNTARITGYSLDDPTADRRTHTNSATRSITVEGARLTKTVDAPTATIGEERDYTIVATIPPLVNFYDAALIDVVPAEISLYGAAMTCTYTTGGGDCMGDLPWAGGTSTSGTTHAWWLGDILSHASERTITLTYSGTVLNDTDNVAGFDIVDTADLRWGIVNTLAGPPAGAVYSPGQTSGPGTATVNVVEPDVDVAKTVNNLDADTVAPGEVFTYRVTITNPTAADASTAYDVTVEDVVPANVLVDPASLVASGGVLTGANPVTGGGTIAWSLASLPVGPGSAVTFTYTATVAGSEYLDTSTLTNDVTVTGFTSHPLTTPGFDDAVLRTYTGPTADADVTPEFPDPTITKTAAAGPAYIGESKGFTITVTNDGDSDAINAEVVDTLPANWIYDAGSTQINSVGAADPAVAGQDLTWSALPDLVPTASFTIYYTARPDASATWTGLNTGSAVDHQNDVTVTVDDVSTSPENLLGTYTDSSSEVVQIHAADLAIDKAHDPLLDPTAGSSFSWTLTVTNSASSDPAVGPIVVVDTLPADAVYTGFTGAGWTDDASVAGQVTFTHAGPVATNGALPIITVNVTLGADVLDDTDFTNVVSVSARTFDPDTSNNDDTDPASTVIVADVELVKTSVGGPFTAGETITWNLTATNLGPSVAVAPFVVTDSLPATIDRSTVVTSGAGWSCDSVTLGGTLVCTWSTATLGVGDSTDTLVVSATVLPTTVGDVDNTATVTHTTPDPDLDNNTDDTSDTVNTSADLSLTKTTVSVDIPANGTGRFRIEIANAGPSDALNVVVSDTLPGGLTFDDTLANLTSAAGDTWTCIPTGGDPALPLCTLTSSGGTLPPGGSSWFEFDVQADATVTAAVLNIATVGSDTPDPDGDNNTDDSTTAPRLTVNKSANSPVIRRGSQVTYTINVESLSYGATDDVTLIDPIPSALRVDSISLELSTDPTVPDWTDPCALAGEDLDGYGGTVTCVLAGTLERGRTTPNIVIVATVKPSTPPGSIDNVAEVQWTDPEDLIAGVFSENDDALISLTLSDAELAASGAMGLPQKLAAALIALTLGAGMVVIARRRRGEDEWA